MDYENYLQEIQTESSALINYSTRRTNILGLHISWLEPAEALPLVAAAAERAWLVNQDRQEEQSHTEPIPHWQIEIEEWMRTGLDSVWQHLATGAPLNASDFDPGTFPEHQWSHQADLTNTMSRSFAYFAGTMSAEYGTTASFEHMLPFYTQQPRDYRSAWHSDTFSHHEFSSARSAEDLLIMATNPLRAAPRSWVERDLKLLNNARSTRTYQGLREIASVDAQVGRDLMKQLATTLMPASGPLTTDVWPAEVRRVTEMAIERTYQQQLGDDVA